MTNSAINLANYDNKSVVIKLASGRAISGFLQKGSTGYTIRLGILDIDIVASDVKKVTVL